MTKEFLPSSSYDYFYLEHVEHPSNRRYSFSISFEIPLEPQYSSSFQVGIMGLVKNDKIENFELYLTLWALDNEKIKQHLSAQEVTSLTPDVFKDIKNAKVKIDSNTMDFTDFIENTCLDVIKPYIKELKLDSREYLKKFDEKMPRFLEQVRNKKLETIFAENQCSVASIHLFFEALENNHKRNFFNKLDNFLTDKPSIKGKKI